MEDRGSKMEDRLTLEGEKFYPPSSILDPGSSVSGSRRRGGANQDFSSRLQNQIFSVLNQDRASADSAAQYRADGRAFTTAGDTADDRAERAAGDAASRGVFGPAAGFDVAFLVNGLDSLALVNSLDLAGESAGAAVARPDRVEGQGHLGFTGGLARFSERGDVTFEDRKSVV